MNSASLAGVQQTLTSPRMLPPIPPAVALKNSVWKQLRVWLPHECL